MTAAINTKIINKNELATSEARVHALDIIKAGFKRVDPRVLMESSIMYDNEFNSLNIQNKVYDIIRGRIFIVGGGKAAGLMVESIEKIIGVENITAGVVSTNNTNYNSKKIKIYRAAHPIPSRSGIEAVEKMLQLKKKYNIGKGDLVLCLISGGASAIMPCPIDAIRLKDKQETTKLLLESGAPIEEINTIRKHLSKIKGGRFAAYFGPAKVVSVIISDVIGNDLSTIASGLTVPDSTTFKDAYNIVLKYNLLDKLPVRVRDCLERGNNGKLEETPKELPDIDNYIIGDNSLALEAMALEAKTLGYNPKIVTPEISGDPEFSVKKLTRNIISGGYAGYDVILVGGETTPALPEKHGKGGRNQHFVAASVDALKDYRDNWTVAAVATDGADFIPGVAGAIADNKSIISAREMKLNLKESLVRYDTNTFFKKLGGSIINTGDTGTNVGDIVVYIIK